VASSKKTGKTEVELLQERINKLQAEEAAPEPKKKPLAALAVKAALKLPSRQSSAKLPAVGSDEEHSCGQEEDLDVKFVEAGAVTPPVKRKSAALKFQEFEAKFDYRIKEWNKQFQWTKNFQVKIDKAYEAGCTPAIDKLLSLETTNKELQDRLKTVEEKLKALESPTKQLFKLSDFERNVTDSHSNLNKTLCEQFVTKDYLRDKISTELKYTATTFKLSDLQKSVDANNATFKYALSGIDKVIKESTIKADKTSTDLHSVEDSLKDLSLLIQALDDKAEKAPSPSRPWLLNKRARESSEDSIVLEGSKTRKTKNQEN
jgi:hypothetical protein